MPRLRHERTATVAEGPPVERAHAGNSRMRIALIVILAILLVLLAAILSFVYTVIAPGIPDDVQRRTEGLIWIRSIYGASASEEDQLKAPAHTAIGPDGTIWVTDAVMRRVLGFNPDGSFSRELRAAGEDPSASMLQGPAGIAVGEDGDVYVAASLADVVIVWGPNGDVDRVFEVPAPVQIAVRGDRALVTSAEGLFLFTTEGEQIASWSSRGADPDQVDMPNGAVIGDDGTLYIADTHNAQIKALSADGAEVLWATPDTSARAEASAGTAATEPLEMGDIQESHPDTSTGSAETAEDLTSTLELPLGMTMDGAGRLIFADAFAFALYAVDPSTGEILARWGDQGEADGLFNYPMGIAYDSDRDWFAVADTANGRVQIVRIDGSGGSPLAAVRRVQAPWVVCAIPLFLLFLIAMVAAARRSSRRKRAAEAASIRETDLEDAVVHPDT